MIKWFEDNPAGKTLILICGGLVVVSLLLAVIWMLPPSAPSMDAEDENRVASLDLPELQAVESIEEYAVITERPIFNETRLPVLTLGMNENSDEELQQEDIDAPEMELAGVIITPSLRMATLREKGNETSLVAFEGMPLEGNYGTWQISRIEPREVTLSSGDGEEVQLQLQIHDMKIAEPPQAEKPPAETEARGERTLAAREGDQPLSRAEEIRQRIAERREELRRAAEADKEDNTPSNSQSNQQRNKQSYKDAIQSMMTRKSRDKSENDENQ
jgi:hypothetical protein